MTYAGENMKKIVTFGELMLRLMPDGYSRFVQADRFGAVYGGAEANVAVTLANFGLDSRYVTRLPENELGQAAVNSLRRFGVDTEYIVRGGDRIGIYFLEKGASQRGSLCIYDRAHSAFAESAETAFDWEEIFKGADWFHLTGVTPALGETIARICLKACRAAKAAGLTVSCDLNYRSRLWSRDQARKTMTGLSRFVDVCFCNEEDARNVFGIETAGSDIDAGRLDLPQFEKTARELSERYGFKKTAVTLRSSVSASDNKWAAVLYDGRNCYFSREYDVHIVERVGSGDAFAGALIYAFLQDMKPQAAVDFASAAACLKHSIEGDFNMVSVQEVMRVAAGTVTGRVQR